MFWKFDRLMSVYVQAANSITFVTKIITFYYPFLRDQY